MVTVDYLEKEVLKGKSLEDLEEADLVELQQNYLVVTLPPEFVPHAEEGVELDDAKIEEQKVESSPEFEAATEIYNNTFGGLANSLLFGTIFLILLTRKLDSKLDASWWVVFIPIFLERGGRWLLNLHRCVCGGVVGDEIIVHMSPEGTEEEVKDPAKTEKKDDDEQQENAEDPDNSTKKDTAVLESVKDKVKKIEAKKVKKSNSNEKESKVDDNKSLATENDESKEEGEAAKPDDVKAAASKDKSNADESDAKATSDGAENIHIDEETFHAWQSAYEQAEENAMQEQAKASSECCNLTLQLILLCLIVAKVDKAYESVDPNDSGFNVFWILAPFFIFFGVICCCCTLLIYGAAPGNAEEIYDDAVPGKSEEVDPENPPSNDPPEAAVIQEPQAETESQPTEEAITKTEETKPLEAANPSSDEEKEKQPTDQKVEEQDSNMEDLD
jgi:hypothetical protein